MNFLTSKFKSPGRLTIAGAPEGRAALALVELVFGAAGRTVLHIARDDASMARTADMLAFFAPTLDVSTLPAWDCLPYDRVSPRSDILAQRIDALTKLAADQTPAPPMVITTIAALMQKIPVRENFTGTSLIVTPKSGISRDQLLRFLDNNSYGRSETVMEPGEYAIINRDWRYIHYLDGEELYDVQADPNEWENLASKPGHEEVKANLRKKAPKSFAPPATKLNRRKHLVTEGESFRWEIK